MADKKDQQTTEKQSEIGIIRNILMGEQMSEYSASFEQLRTNLAEAKNELTSKLEETGGNTGERIDQLEKDITQRLDKLEKEMLDHIARLDKKLIEITKADKQDLGKMMAEISKKLMS